MDSFTAFVYSWHIDDEGIIHGFALDPENKTVHLEVSGFTPYVYLELPVGIEWTELRRQAILSTISEFPSDVQPMVKSFMNKKKLYDANVVLNPKYDPKNKESKEEKYTYKTYPYLFLAFNTRTAMTGFMKKMSYGTYIPSLGKKIRFKFHEQLASSILQFTCLRKLPMTGWATGKGKLILDPGMKTSSCAYEYEVKWTDIGPCTDQEILKVVPCPTILAFDGEANSDNVATMPKNRPNDKMFQLSFAVTRHGSGKVYKHLLSLGNPDQKETGEDIIIHTYPTEGDLLIGFCDLIHEIDPQVITGYNIVGWDFMYLIQRAKLNGVFAEFTKYGYLKGVQAKEKSISWSSSAFNSQHFTFLDAPGRLLIDMLPIVRRDFKFSRYDLGSVAAEILGQTKDPLTHKGIFKCYRIFSPKSLGLVGKYCFVPGTRVSLGSCSIPIEQLGGVSADVLTWDEEKSGFRYSQLVNHFDNGTRECVELTFSDGSVVKCTEDHKFLTTNGWVEAKDLTQDMKVRFGPEQALCDFATEKNSTFSFSESVLNLSYDKACIFARLLGYLLTDGSIDSTRAKIHFGTEFDAIQANSDIMSLVGKVNPIRREVYTYSVHLPAELRKMMVGVKGVEIGRRLTSSSGLPEFLNDSKTPRWVIREFLKGLMGGDGWSCGLSKKEGKITAVGFSQSKTERQLSSLYKSMETLSKVFKDFGIESVIRSPKKNKCGNGITIELTFTIESIIPFYENIGYAYCYSKSYRTAVAVSYLRLRNKVREQFNYVCDRTRELMNEGTPSKQARDIACFEVELNFPVYAPASLPSADVARKNRDFYSGEFKTRRGRFPKFDEYLKTVEAHPYFTSESTSKSHVLKQEAEVAPGFVLSLLRRRPIGPCQTYDIEVKDTHTFVANGAVVHNCCQDSNVTLLLFDKLKTWVGMCQMSAIFGVGIVDLYTQGQQLKIYSQVYRECLDKNIVVEQDAFQCAEDETYTGAIVLDPEPGMYKDVVTFDFASLYPSVMMANNICYSTRVTDPNIPDEDCHVFDWWDHQGCIVEGETVSLQHSSVPIETLADNKTVITFGQSGTKKGAQTGFYNQGMKECVKLTLFDGTELKCTPDHRILTESGWKEAKDLILGTDKVKVGVQLPKVDVSGELDDNYSFTVGEHTYRLDTIETYNRSLTISRLIGLILSDGSIGKTRTSIWSGTQIDVNSIVGDIQSLIDDFVPVSRQENVWKIHVPQNLMRNIWKTDGVVNGKRSTQHQSLPTFLSTAPKCIIREFLGGLFGGDGHTLSYSKSAKSFGHIALSMTSVEEHLDSLYAYMEQIRGFIRMFDIDSTIMDSYHSGTGNYEVKLTILAQDTVKFHERIGFRYCEHKSVRLMVGSSYYKYRDNINRQRNWVVEKVKSRGSVTVEQAINSAHIELRSTGYIFNEHYSLPTKSAVTDMMRERYRGTKTSFQTRYGVPSVLDYLEIVGATHLFLEGYAVKQYDGEVPVVTIPVVHRENIGVHQTYDIQVDNTHSFLCNGIVVHNCEHDTTKRTTKVKKIVCTRRKYRFLKSPAGVLPTLLRNLISRRKAAKKEGESEEARAKTIDDPELKKAILMYAMVCDMKQLALKVSANSVRADTPIPCRINGKIVYRKIEELSIGDWKAINNDQEVSSPISNLEVWSDAGFTSVPYIMRHPKSGPLKQIVTHTGIVECTEDHSLLRDTGEEVRPRDLTVGDKLLHTPLPLPIDTPERFLYDELGMNTINKHVLETKDERKAFAEGFFFAEGTCGEYGLLESAKTSWIVYNNDKPLLEKVRAYFTECEGQSFAISDFYTSAGVYHLRPIKTIIPIARKYREMFYDSRGYKKVPDHIIHASYAVRLAFFLGKHAGDGSHHLNKGVVFSNRGQIGTAGLVYLAHSLGYKTSVSVVSDDIYRVQCIVRYYRNVNLTAVKSMANENTLAPVKVLKPDLIRNSVKIVLTESGSNYRGVQVSCVRTPRQALLNSLDKAITIANTRNSDVISYRTDKKKVSYQKRCCGSVTEMDLRSLLYNFPEAHDCGCGVYMSSDYNTLVPEVASTEPVVEYVYDIETGNHHFSAGIGEMVVHNSMYGGMGVRKGKLPFMPGAMTTTAGGREAIMLAKKLITEKYPGKTVYGDTDSLMYIFDHMERFRNAEGKTDYKALEKHACEVSEDISKAFPPPMKLEYENTAEDFFILTKKRYMTKLTTGKYKKRGIMITRRDNAPVCRNVYEGLLKCIFAYKSKEETLYFLVQALNDIYSRKHPTKEYSITKSIKEIDEYKIKPADKDPEKRRKQFANKFLDVNKHSDADYLLRSLPAHVQLAERMRRRGMFVEAGSRIEFVVTTSGGFKGKMWQKIESFDYYREHSDMVFLDMNYYCKSLVNPGDQALETAFGVKKFFKDQLALRLMKQECMEELRGVFATTVSFEE